MTRRYIESVILFLLELSKKFHFKLVFVGGIALNFLIQPRTTYDIDCFIDISEEKLKQFLKFSAKKGFAIEKNKFY